MSKRLNKVFQERGDKPLLSIFYTAGFPSLDSTVEIGRALADAGVDFLEIGIPFSDPVADGPTIQESSGIALANGMTLPLLLEQVAELRKQVDIPLILMGYINPVIQYGVEKFFSDISASGVDGVILPDLPLHDLEERYQKICIEHDIATIFLVSPQTSEERVRKIDELSSGFLYAVSSPSITGGALTVSTQRDEYLKRLSSYDLKNPLVVGFGIKDRESFDSVTQFTPGAIIGSAFIKHLEREGVDRAKIAKFIKSIKD